MVRHYRRALALSQHVSDAQIVATAMAHLAEALTLQGRPREALRLLARLRPAELERLKDRSLLQLHTEQARALLAQARNAAARAAIQRALAVCERLELEEQSAGTEQIDAELTRVADSGYVSKDVADALRNAKVWEPA